MTYGWNSPAPSSLYTQCCTGPRPLVGSHGQRMVGVAKPLGGTTLLWGQGVALTQWAGAADVAKAAYLSCAWNLLPWGVREAPGPPTGVGQGLPHHSSETFSPHSGSVLCRRHPPPPPTVAGQQAPCTSCHACAATAQTWKASPCSQAGSFPACLMGRGGSSPTKTASARHTVSFFLPPMALGLCTA